MTAQHYYCVLNHASGLSHPRPPRWSSADRYRAGVERRRLPCTAITATRQSSARAFPAPPLSPHLRPAPASLVRRCTPTPSWTARPLAPSSAPGNPRLTETVTASTARASEAEWSSSAAPAATARSKAFSRGPEDFPLPGPGAIDHRSSGSGRFLPSVRAPRQHPLEIVQVNLFPGKFLLSCLKGEPAQGRYFGGKAGT